MSTAEAFNIVEFEFEAEIADRSGGGFTTHGPLTFNLQPANSTGVFRTPLMFEIPAGLLGGGDLLTIKMARRGSTGAQDSHGGDFQRLSMVVTTATVPKADFTTALVQSVYLERASFNAVTPNVTGVQEYPDFAGDFETWQLLASTQAAGQIHVAFQGRLDVTEGQTQITRIEIPIKGSAGSDYRLRVFAEDTVPPVHDSGLTAAPTVRTVLVLNVGDFSAQPGTEGRFHVVIEATLDNLEELRVGRPFATME